MPNITIAIKDNATPAIRKVTAALASPELRAVIGRAGRNIVRTHLFGLDRQRHRSSVSHHFYANAARATNFRVEPDGAIVSINQVGIAQRYYGGEIKPRKSKYLTIPARSEAEGKRAREFNNLKFLFGRKGPYALAEREHSKIQNRQSSGGGIFYWLVKSVSQRPDPSVLPTREQLERTVGKTAENYINRILARK